jgi:hypothetical protein
LVKIADNWNHNIDPQVRNSREKAGQVKPKGTDLMGRILAETEASAGDDPAEEKPKSKRRKTEQGSILQNSISAENFSDKFSSSKFWTNIPPKTTSIILSLFYGHSVIFVVKVPTLKPHKLTIK